jgi:hypothetical protein
MSLLTGSSKAPMSAHGRQEPSILNGRSYHGTSITGAQASHGALSFMHVNDLEGIGTWTDNWAHGASPVIAFLDLQWSAALTVRAARLRR